VELESQDPPRYIGTILWRNSDRFINIPNEGYVLASRLTEEQKRRIGEANLVISDMTRELLPMVASEYASETGREQMLEALRLWDASERFPSDIDGPLLVKAREIVGQELNPAERRFLRLRTVEKFREALG